MKTLLIVGIILALFVGCAHSPHPYKTKPYEEATVEIYRLTHADAPPMPDTQQFWLKSDFVWWGPLAALGVLFVQGLPIWIMIAMWIAL
ncbi:MAG: hypothetical protein ACFFCW_41115 [Candidatus Hodarchaeota archaeon]